MKKNNIWYVAALVSITAFLFSVTPLFSQQGGVRLSTTISSGANSYQADLLQSLGITAVISDSVDAPPVNVLKEPAFTVGRSNIFYWTPFPDLIEFKVNGQVLTADRDDCLIIISYKPENSTEPSKTSPVNASETSNEITIFDDSWLNRNIEYSFQLLLNTGGQTYSDVKTKSYLTCYQDTIPPTLDRLEVTGTGKNGWMTADDIALTYYGLQDTAAIHSVSLSGAIQATDSSMFNDDPIDPQPRIIDNGTFNIDVDLDGEHLIKFGACDASFTALSHGDPNAVWSLGKNCDNAIDSLIVKVDRTPPTIDLSTVSPLYNANSKEYNSNTKTLEFSFAVIDEWSHVDRDSITKDFVFFEPPLPFKYDDISSTYDDSGDTCFVTIRLTNVQDADSLTTFKAILYDSAGNRSYAEKAVQFNFNPPKITDFTMVDPDYVSGACLAPDSLHANESRMYFYNFDKNANDIVRMRLTVAINGAEIGDFSTDFLKADTLINPLQVLDRTDSFQHGNSMSVTISAIDVDGNEQAQESRQTRSIMFDRMISDISVSAKDTTAWDSTESTPLPGRRGAYPDWTNEPIVLVNIEFDDNDLYRIQESKPKDSCFTGDAVVKKFYRIIHDSTPGEIRFTYQVGDFAGNTSNIASDDITLDTTIFKLDSSHIKVCDPVTKSEELTASDSVEISLKKERLPEQDISRIVINNKLYYAGVNTVLTVPTGDGKFTFSVIDFAGNESNDMRDSIKVAPGFTFKVFDRDSTAQPGWTNEGIVGWDTLTMNFDLEQLDVITFSNEDGSRTDDWRRGDPKTIDLSRLFDLKSCSVDTVYGAARLKNGAETPSDYVSHAFIKFDNLPPMIDSLTLSDTDNTSNNQRTAQDGFTNNLDISLEITVSDDCSSADSISISGNGSVLTDDGPQDLPAVVPFSGDLTIKLNEEANLFVATLSCAVRDSAGNWMADPAEKETSIIYLNQTITLAPTSKMYKVANTELPEFTFSLSINCDYKNYLAFAEITDTGGNVLGTVEAEKFEYNADSSMCSIPFDLSEAKQGTYFVSVVDSAGNVSENKIEAKVEVVEKPVISLKLYDFTEYKENDLAASDDQYTDELNELKKIKARVERDSTAGTWEQIRFAFAGQAMKDNWLDVTDDDVFTLDIPIDTIDIACNIIVLVQAQNSEFESDVNADTILHDIVSPNLISFSAAQIDESSEWRITYEAQDQAECGSGIAGIVIKDSLAGRRTNKWFYRQHQGGTTSITLEKDSGSHFLSAYVLDNADIDQTVVSHEANSEEELVAVLIGNGGRVDHASNMIKDYKVLALANMAYNFPNPFNPEIGTTKINIPLKDVSTVDLRIFDLFGNLVWEHLGATPSETGGDFLVEWTGRNGHGDIVASGTYLAIIKPDNGDALDPIKIGVLRKQGF